MIIRWMGFLRVVTEVVIYQEIHETAIGKNTNFLKVANYSFK